MLHMSSGLIFRLLTFAMRILNTTLNVIEAPINVWYQKMRIHNTISGQPPLWQWLSNASLLVLIFRSMRSGCVLFWSTHGIPLILLHGIDDGMCLIEILSIILFQSVRMHEIYHTSPRLHNLVIGDVTPTIVFIIWPSRMRWFWWWHDINTRRKETLLKNAYGTQIKRGMDSPTLKCYQHENM